MNAATPLVDYAPVLRMALLVGVIALVPLAWLWLRQRGADTRNRSLDQRAVGRLNCRAEQLGGGAV